MRIITNDNMTAKDRLSFLRQINWQIRHKVCVGFEKMGEVLGVGAKAVKELAESLKKVKGLEK